MFLFYDTETTGFPSGDHTKASARVCQLGAVLTDLYGNEMHTLNHFIKPDGWKVSEFNIKHGITQELCEKEGKPLAEVIDLFSPLVARAIHKVAFNNKFDIQMLNIEYWVLHKDESKLFDRHTGHFCAMNCAKPICKIPGTVKMGYAGIKGYKQPKLIEAYRHFFGKDFDDAHDALADVRATKDIFFEMMRRGHIKLEGDKIIAS